MDSKKIDALTTGLGDLLLQHSEIGDWCEVVDKQIDEVGYEISESKKTSTVSHEPIRYFAPPFHVYVSNVNFNAAISDIFYFFGGHEKVSNVYMCRHGNSAFNGSCFIELKNFVSLIDALKLDSENIMDRRITVEHVTGERRRCRYTDTELENACEDIRRKDGGRHHNQGRSSLGGARDGRRQPPSSRSSLGSFHGGNIPQPLTGGDRAPRGSAPQMSNDVRLLQPNAPNANQTNLASNFQRGGQRGGQQQFPRNQQQRNAQHSILPRNARQERQPLLETPKPIPKPTHSDIYGLGKPADTMNKLMEIQEKLDKELRMVDAPPVVNEIVEVPHHHQGGRHSGRQSHGQEASHNKSARPCIGQSGLEAIKKVVTSNSAESVRNSSKSASVTVVDSVTNDVGNATVDGGNNVSGGGVNGGRTRKSFSRDSQKSGAGGGGGGGGRRSGASKGSTAKMYINSSKKSLSHQSSASGEHNAPSERKQSNHQIPTVNNGEHAPSQQSRQSFHKGNRSEFANEPNSTDSQFSGRKASVGNARPPHPSRSEEHRHTSSMKSNRKRNENKATESNSQHSVASRKQGNQLPSNANAKPAHKEESADVALQPASQHTHKVTRAASAGEPVSDKQVRKSSADNARSAPIAAEAQEPKPTSTIASPPAKHSKSKKKPKTQTPGLSNNRYGVLTESPM